MEAENAMALSVARPGAVSPGFVVREKAIVLKKSGLLKILPVKETLRDIGGLDVLKEWLLKRREAFGAAARQFGLPAPATANATASEFGLPLLRLDVGKIFAGLVGQIEETCASSSKRPRRWPVRPDG